MKTDRLCCVPSQTIGPFFHFALTADAALGCLAQPEARGERIRVCFRLLDGDGAPVRDAMIEIWQADASGKYDHPEDPQPQAPDPAFRGFGRLATDADGCCVFDTVRPGRAPAGHGRCQASHLNVSVFARGLLVRLATRVYFEGDAGLAEDPVLALVPEDRRATLLARRDAALPAQWNFDIHLQGEDETVFFDI
jgi:protocatechuate 3,4-dioxygenase, alpha subunit